MKGKFIKRLFVAINVASIGLYSSHVKAESWKYTNFHSGFQKIAGSNWCWVASARNMAVGRYSPLNITKSQSTVVQEIKGSIIYKAGTLSETKTAVNKFTNYTNAGIYHGIYTKDNIRSSIDDGLPLLLDMQNDYSSTNHAIITFGYDRDSNKFYIYDPDTGRYYMSYKKIKNCDDENYGLLGFHYENTIYFIK